MKIFLIVASFIITVSVSAQTLIPYQVQDYHHFDQARLWGYKDESFKIVITPMNEQPAIFSNGYAVLKKNNKFGLIDKTGWVVIDPKYAFCSDVAGGYVTVQDAGGMTSATYVISVKTGETFGADRAMFGTSEAATDCPDVFILKHEQYNGPYSYGLVNAKGEQVLSPVYASIYPFFAALPATTDFGESPGAFIVEDATTHLYGLAGSDGKLTFQPKYSSIGNLHNGLAKVSLNHKYGFIDFTGAVAIPLQYDAAEDFTSGVSSFVNNDEGYAAVKLGAESFFIDTKNKAVFKGKGLQKAMSEENFSFIIREKNDSVYVTDKNMQHLFGAGANDIVTTDGNNFLAMVGTKVYALNKQSAVQFPLENVAGISVFSVGLYNIVNKNAAGKYAYTITDAKFKPLINQSDLFTYEVDKGLSYLGIYFHNTRTDEDVLFTYIDNTGKEFSDISR